MKQQNTLYRRDSGWLCAPDGTLDSPQTLAAGDREALVISVSCVGRRLVLGERTDEELESVLEPAPPGVAHVGFHSYGEISPSLQGGASALHNQTMTVTAFSER